MKKICYVTKNTLQDIAFLGRDCRITLDDFYHFIWGVIFGELFMFIALYFEMWLS